MIPKSEEYDAENIEVSVAVISTALYNTESASIREHLSDEIVNAYAGIILSGKEELIEKKIKQHINKCLFCYTKIIDLVNYYNSEELQ